MWILLAMQMKTQGVVADDIISIIKSLKNTSKTIFEYFKINFLKGNADKCQLLIIS